MKNPPAMWETWVCFLGWEDPLEKGMAIHASILAWKSHRQKSLADPSPWDRKESNTTEGLPLSFSNVDDTGSGSLLEPEACLCVSYLYEGDLL